MLRAKTWSRFTTDLLLQIDLGYEGVSFYCITADRPLRRTKHFTNRIFGVHSASDSR